MSRKSWILVSVLAVGSLVGGAMFVQEDDEPGPPPSQQGGRGGGMHMPMMGGGEGSMLVHDGHIFVLMGAKLFKVSPADMKVVAELELVKMDTMSRPRSEGPRRPRERKSEDDE